MILHLPLCSWTPRNPRRSPGAGSLLALAAVLAAVLTGPAQAAERITFSGKAYPYDRVEVIMPTQGVVQDLRVSFGKFVKNNEVLMTYATTWESLIKDKLLLSPVNVKKLEFRLADATAKLNNEKRQREKLLSMLSKGMDTENALIQKDYDIMANQKSVEAITENLANEREALKFQQELAWYRLGINNATPYTIPKYFQQLTPIDGHVLWINPTLRKNAQIAKDERVFIVGDLRKVDLICLVYEAAAQKLKPGMKAMVRFVSLDNATFPGVVEKIQLHASALDSTSGVSNFEVYVRIENKDLIIKEGLVGLAEVDLDQAVN